MRALGAQGVHLRARGQRHHDHAQGGPEENVANASALARMPTHRALVVHRHDVALDLALAGGRHAPQLQKRQALWSACPFSRVRRRGANAWARARAREGARTFWEAMRSCRPPRVAAGMTGANASAESTQAAAAAATSVFENAIFLASCGILVRGQCRCGNPRRVDPTRKPRRHEALLRERS